MALEQADVMKWTENQKGVAVQRNYAISIPKSNNNKRVNLSLQMHILMVMVIVEIPYTVTRF
jgi:hypothetical protein